ncbi:MAG: hypothetical protein FWB80_07960 [Defluviitaleaceae bacterium]|nr:hypothetical protein [Defluviitaleaceae bacterium]
MFITWEEAKAKYPDKWVVFKDPQYKDIFHMNFIGGIFVGTADDQEEMEKLIPYENTEDDDYVYLSQHTRGEDAVGLLKSGF